MAIYHLSVKTVSRSAGRSATGAAAYRSGERIVDERTGEVHDYTRKGGVLFSEIVTPVDAPEWAFDRSALWNAAEQAETRKNSTVAREFIVALPAELSAPYAEAFELRVTPLTDAWAQRRFAIACRDPEALTPAARLLVEDLVAAAKAAG